MYNITIETKNEAFRGPDQASEIARILDNLASDLRTKGLDDYVLKDLNGNTVGNAQQDQLYARAGSSGGLSFLKLVAIKAVRFSLRACINII